MLELTGMGSVLRGLGVLYWLVALACLIAAFKLPRTVVAKGAAVAIVIALFSYLPVTGYIESQKRQAYQREAWAYFKNKCATEAGEKIYKTFSGVKSVVVVKPLPPATDSDMYDQYWYGDPYSAPAHSRRGYMEAGTLLGPSPLSNFPTAGFDFVEFRKSATTGDRFIRLFKSAIDLRDTLEQAIDKATSRFAISWQDISTKEDRAFWVAGSRLSIVDLHSNQVVAERTGFLIESGFGSTAGQRRPWLTSRGSATTCPSLVNGTFDDRVFVLKVLKGVEDSDRGK